MNKVIVVFSFILALLASAVHADVVDIEYFDSNGEYVKKQNSPYFINPQNTFTVSVSAGVGRKIVLQVLDKDSNVVAAKTKLSVDINDTFIRNEVTYFGVEFELDSMPDGEYELQSVIYNDTAVISSQSNVLVVDNVTPSIVGEFFWSPFGAYSQTHSDGKLIVSRTGADEAGYPSINVGASGYSHATYSSKYVSGPLSGSFHAVDLPVLLTNSGKLVIGNGTSGSITSAYIPDATSSAMQLSFTVYNNVGVSSTRTIDLYVSTKPAASKPTPYGLYTGTPSKLDNIDALAGFVPYTPGMAVSTNPVRMIYRANKEHYFGGGGDADIYGGWVNGTRNTSKVIYSDAQFIYFDITGSSDGTRINEGQAYIRDMSSWRRYTFDHALNIDPLFAPPKATGLEFYIQGKGEWRNGAVTQYITKKDTNGQTDSITKIRISVEQRTYDQKFTYDFNRDGSRYRGECIVIAGETECVVDSNLPYPGDDLSVYHNRHKIMGIGNSLLSPEIVSVWYYDGSIAELDTSSIQHDSQQKRITFSAINRYADRAWASGQVRDMTLTAISQSGTRTLLPRESLISTPIDVSTQQSTGSFNYASLPDGEYEFEAFIADGFGPVNARNEKTHFLLSDSIVDVTAPTISTNIIESKVDSLSSILISIEDANPTSITSVLLSGGVNNVNISLPIVQTALTTFKPEHIFVLPSDGQSYTITINATDVFGNQSVHSESFNYIPTITRLPDIKQPAIASALRSEIGVPANVIRTPQIRSAAGDLAQGNHQIYVTVTPEAQSPMIINGSRVAPGETTQFVANLSLNNHMLSFEAYPESSGQVLTNGYQIHIPNIRVSLCPEGFTINGESCIHLSFTNPNLNCNSPFSLNGAQCEYEFSYDPSTECAEGYTRFGTTCSGNYTVAPISTCQAGYALVDSSSCMRTSTIPANVCNVGDVAENHLCKKSDGTFVQQKIYCDGRDVSAGPVCEGDNCYTYKSEWNACELTTTALKSNKCQVGTFTNGNCQVSDEYQLNMECPFGYNRDGILCKRLEINEPIRNCEAGYTLSGSVCSKTESSPFISCPSTHYLNAGRCHTIEPIQITCPDTYSWNGSSCSRVDQEAATPICPVDYTFNGTTCQRDQYVDGTPVCPESYTLENGICTNRIVDAATPICPVDYVWNGSTCQKSETQLAERSCASGYSWNGSTCTKAETTAATPSCSTPGYSWNGTTCSKVETLGATPSCGTGYSWDGSTCKKTNTTAATLSCPTDYTWNGSTCAKIETSSATPNCSVGYSWTGSICAKTNTTAATPNCSAGFTWNGSTCAKTNTELATINCSEGYSWNGTTCARTQTTEASPNCSAGYSWNGSTCAKTEINDASRSCPSGFSWNGTTCAKSESTAASRSCPSGYSWNGTTCAKSESTTAARNCASGYTWNGTTCAKTESTSAARSCSSGYTWNGTTCAKSESTTAARSCASGYTWNGSTCTKTQSASATVTRTCPSGGTLSGTTCTMTSAASLSCPMSYNESTWQGTCTYQASTLHDAATRSCHFSLFYCRYNDGRDTYLADTSKVVSGIANYSCSSGWTLSGSTCTKTYTATTVYSCASGWSLSSTTCSRVLTQAPTYSCSAGWTLSGTTCSRTLTQAPIYSCSAGWTLSGTTCSRTLTQSPTYSCSAGWTLSGTTCSRTLTQSPTYSCSAGWTLSGTTCSRSLTQSPTYSCSAGWTLSGTTCSRTLTQSPTYSCSAGWALSGTTCSRTLTQSPTYSCGAGWSLSGSTCSQTVTQAPTYSCSSGWTLSGSTCNQTVTEAPTYSCSAGWTLSGTSCSRTLTQPESYSCSAEWTLSGGTCSQVVTQSATYSCPTAGGWALVGENCSRTLTESAVYSCSTTGGWTLSGATCNRTLSDAPTYSCPTIGGWELSGINCNRLLTMPPAEYICDPDEIVEGDTCTQIIVTDPISYLCEAGWSNEGARCHLRTTAAISAYQCDSGWELDGSMCKITRTVTETRFCRSTFTQIDSNSCFYNVPSTSIGNCETGWMVNATQCTRVMTHSPELSCPSTYELILGQCHKQLSEPVSVSCQPDETVVDGRCVILKKHVPLPVCDAPYLLENPTSCRLEITVPKYN